MSAFKLHFKNASDKTSRAGDIQSDSELMLR